MVVELEQKSMEIADLCRRFQVKELHLFGSSTRASSLSDVGDLDFLVRFAPLPPASHAESYFGLAEGLTAMFDRRVDLVEMDAIRNPFFREAVEESRKLIYAAA